MRLQKEERRFQPGRDEIFMHVYEDWPRAWTQSALIILQASLISAYDQSAAVGWIRTYLLWNGRLVDCFSTQ